MMNFFITLSAVAMMLGYASIGFLMIKGKLIKEDAISAFAKLLLYVSSPCLTIYSISKVECNKQTLFDALICLIFAFVVQGGLQVLFRYIYKNHVDDVNYRVHNVATAMGNTGFMAVPLLEAIMPDYPEAVFLSTVYCIAMNIIGWTVTVYFISNDKKYMRVKNAFLNPGTLALIVAIPIYLTGFKLPTELDTMITLLGKMSAPLCMIVMGARLGTMKFKSLFIDKHVYLTIGIKQILMPMLSFFVLMALPMSFEFKEAIFILTAAPVASMVLNYAELIGQGQKKAANLVLLGTLLSIVTMPVMMLIMYH